jgi:DNA-binding HxlR family transcriptional regulator
MSSHRDRSPCPIAYGLDVLGDRWTLLILRDLAFKERHYFSDFLGASERISSKILTDRLARLEDAGLVVKTPDPDDGRRARYFLSDDGLDLLPVMIEIALWGSERHPDPKPGPGELEHFRLDREGAVRRVRTKLTEERERARAETVREVQLAP